MAENKNIPVRLVLSGGGTRGFAHLGIVSALLEAGIQITAVSGASAGAVAGAFLCQGYHPEEVLSFFLGEKPYNLAATAFNEGLLSTRNLKRFLERFLPGSFEELKMPLSVVATDLLSGSWKAFSRGELIPVLAGSCAIPGLIQPVKHKEYLLADGGILNNMPLECVPEEAGKIIALHVNPVATISAPGSAFRILERTFHLGVYSNTIERIKKADFLIEPPGLARYRVFDFKSLREVYLEGYNYTASLTPSLPELLQP